MVALLLAAALCSATGVRAQAVAPKPLKLPRTVTVTGPLAGVPVGQVCVVHIPDARRTLGQIDRVLTALHQDTAINPLRQLLDELDLRQPLHPESSLTVCYGLPAEPRAPLARVVLVTRIDGELVTQHGVRDMSGFVHRKDALAAMVLADGSVALGDKRLLVPVARSVRGIEVSPAEREVLADADVLVRLDVPLLLTRYEGVVASLLKTKAESVERVRKAGASPEQIAIEEEQVRAVIRWWDRLREIEVVTGGLIVDRRAVDVRLSVSVARESSLSGLLADHPPLAGDLNPPLPKQPFVALGYGSFDGRRLAGLMQWATDAMVDRVLRDRPSRAKVGGLTLGLVELADLRHLFDDLGDILGGRFGIVVPVRPATEPVFQMDAVVELAEATNEVAWRSRLPGKLDALTHLLRVYGDFRGADLERDGLETLLEPAPPAADAPIDHWRLMIALAQAADGDGAPTMAKRLLDAVLGPEGLNLWNTAVGKWGYLSVAPDANRVAAMVLRNVKPQLGQAGDGPPTAEALKHTLRRSNAVIIFSPSLASQLAARTLLKGLGDTGATDDGEVPLADPKALAALSLRLSPTNITARCYLPVPELEAVLSTWRTIKLLDGVPTIPQPK
jgi:hypothetical protein